MPDLPVRFPSWATRILRNNNRCVILWLLGARTRLVGPGTIAPCTRLIGIGIWFDCELHGRFDLGPEPSLGDHRRHDGAADHHRHQDRILLLVDVMVMFSPNRALIVPNVRPVDISSVV